MEIVRYAGIIVFFAVNPSSPEIIAPMPSGSLEKPPAFPGNPPVLPVTHRFRPHSFRGSLQALPFRRHSLRVGTSARQTRVKTLRARFRSYQLRPHSRQTSRKTLRDFPKSLWDGPVSGRDCSISRRSVWKARRAFPISRSLRAHFLCVFLPSTRLCNESGRISASFLLTLS